jgi:hypothetical protein
MRLTGETAVGPDLARRPPAWTLAIGSPELAVGPLGDPFAVTALLSFWARAASRWTPAAEVRTVRRSLAVALGILTATGGFIDAGAIVTAGAAGAQVGLGLVMILATIAIVMLVEMSGRLTAVSGKGYADAIRERFGFRFYLVPLSSEIVANTLLLAAALGSRAWSTWRSTWPPTSASSPSRSGPAGGWGASASSRGARRRPSAS